MDYSWIENRPLHLSILKSYNIENYFNCDLFPEIKVGECWDVRHAAEYWWYEFKVIFNETYIHTYIDKFAFVFFHELAHSTAKHTNRIERLMDNGSFKMDQIIGLEERIADLVSLIWCDLINKTPTDEKSVKKVFTLNKTNLSLPWQEVENAVFCLLKNKDCSHVKITLKYYKQLIIDGKLCSIKEGVFNG